MWWQRSIGWTGLLGFFFLPDETDITRLGLRVNARKNDKNDLKNKKPRNKQRHEGSIFGSIDGGREPRES